MGVRAGLGCLFTLMILWAASAEAAAPSLPVPQVDHHQHLVSPAGALLLNTPPSPDLPAEVADLLARRAAAWNDKAALAALFAKDALALDGFGFEWQKGAQAPEFMSRLFARPYRLTPHSYRRDGASAHLAGYYTRGDGLEMRHFGQFYIRLRRGSGGAWTIDTEIPSFPGPQAQAPVSAEALIAQLDAAGIRRAVILSDAYWFDAPVRGTIPADAHSKVRAENAWTLAEAAKFPGRLIPLCSFNPLAAHALGELDRCAGTGKIRGFKLHFNTADVDLLNPEHVAKVRAVAAAANRHRLALTIHVRGDLQVYGAAHARSFLDNVVAAAPDVPVTIAHFWGGEDYSAEALQVYADAVATRDPRTRRLYFDMAELPRVIGTKPEALKNAAAQMRRIGLSRILFGSDGPTTAPADAWAQFRETVPLTAAEFEAIAANVAPYLN
jgi:predicted TIM-barrel fold metal-dependent hydrolase